MSDFGQIRFSAPVGYDKADSEQSARLLTFKERFREDLYAASVACNISSSLIELITELKKIVPSGRINFIVPHAAVLHSDRVFVCITDENQRPDPWESVERNIKITVYGSAELVQAVAARTKELPPMISPRVIWNYLIKGEHSQTAVFLEERREAPDVFYPYIEGGLDNFFDNFMDSSAAILLLRGEPGTGKTSFINRLIWQKQLETMITYEEALFKSDQMFVSFLTSKKTNLLIMEDADALIMSRERHGNETMSKFLNVSDGLLNFKRKKIIITSNVIDEDRIDTALLRRGRCFAAPVFRKLTFAESKVAAEAANKEVPTVDRDYSLAEIVNGPGRAREVRRVGFMGGQEVA